jgi:hypothetical protein
MMKGNKHMKTITNITYPAFALFALICFALSPQARAVCQQGCDSSLFNAFLGDDALISNTTGTGNTALGWRSLFSNTDASFSTAVGGGALVLNNGSSNTAVGAAALLLNTSGTGNTAAGTDALTLNDTGSYNVAVGDIALFSLASTVAGNADNNVAIGAGALANVTEGNFNIAIGFNAGVNLTSGSQNIYIGVDGFPTESSTIRIGSAQTATYIAAISGQTASGGAAVYVNSDGKLGTMTSSRRFKDNINPMDKASELIFSLKPVTFRYKKAIDASGISQFGLVAEDVAKVNPDLVVLDKEGEPYTVRYEAVNAMLLNEFLKEHRQVQEQQKEIDALRAELTEQTALIRKVSARVELQTAPAQTVASNQ